MRLRPWRDDVTEERTDDRTTVRGDDRVGRDDRVTRAERVDREPDRGPAAARAGDDEIVGRDEVIETRKPHWDLASVLATAAGVALTLIGVLALVRTGVDSTWYQPVEQIAGVNHTAMLGAIEVGVGVLLILAGLTGARMLAALVALVAGIAAAVVAIEPSLVSDDLALERGWATTLAIAGVALGLVLIMVRERREERRVERRHFRHA